MGLGVIDWQGMLSTALALAGVLGLLWAALQWLFAPRLRAWWEKLNEPMAKRFDTLEQANEDQHGTNAVKLDELRGELADRWDKHEIRHDELERTLGRLEGTQAAIMSGAERLPQWKTTTDTPT